MSLLMSACFTCPALLATFVEAQNSTSPSAPDNTQKALITVGVLGGCIIIALVVAKIVDYCYDHHIAVNDAASDISEHTRNLIRSRLAVNAFRSKKKPADTPTEISAKQKKIIRIWSAKAKESRRIAEQRRAQDQAKALATRTDLIIKVKEASGEAKLQASLASTSATLSFVSEKLDKGAKPSDSPEPKTVKGSSKVNSKLPMRPELKRTLTGLDSSNKISEAPAMVAVSASGNTAVLPVKESTPQSSTKQYTLTPEEDALDTFRSDTEMELTDRLDPSVSPDPKSAHTDRSGSSKPQGPRLQGSASPRPGRAVLKSPSPKPPTPKAKYKSNDPHRPKTEGDKFQGAQVTKSPSPVHNSVKQPVQSCADSPTTVFTKQAESLPEKSKSSETLSTTVGAKDVSPEEEKLDSPPSHVRSRPLSSLSGKVFTVVRHTPQSTRTKPSSQSPESKASPSQSKTTADSKPRPKSFHAKEEAKYVHMPKKLASSVVLYGRATEDLDKHKTLISMKKAAVSSSRATNQSPSPVKKPEQSPIVVAAAARKARIKSAKP